METVSSRHQTSPCCCGEAQGHSQVFSSSCHTARVFMMEAKTCTASCSAVTLVSISCFYLVPHINVVFTVFFVCSSCALSQHYQSLYLKIELRPIVLLWVSILIQVCVILKKLKLPRLSLQVQ